MVVFERYSDLSTKITDPQGRTMRYIILISLSLWFSVAQSQDIYTDDINSMFYVKSMFGSSNQSAKIGDSLTFGFSVNQSLVNVDGLKGFNLASSDSVHRSLVDIEFSPNTRYFSRFNIGGVDALTYKTVMHANGTGSNSPDGVSSDRIILGLIFGAAVGAGIYFALDDDDDDNGGGLIQPPPPPLQN